MLLVCGKELVIEYFIEQFLNFGEIVAEYCLKMRKIWLYEARPISSEDFERLATAIRPE